jgi:hypothetical protein
VQISASRGELVGTNTGASRFFIRRNYRHERGHGIAATDSKSGASTESGLSLDDVTPANIRGGKLIDFDLVYFAAVPIKPRGVRRRGRVVSINSATEEELRALGPLIKWPLPETA